MREQLNNETNRQTSLNQLVSNNKKLKAERKDLMSRPVSVQTHFYIADWLAPDIKRNELYIKIIKGEDKLNAIRNLSQYNKLENKIQSYRSEIIKLGYNPYKYL